MLESSHERRLRGSRVCLRPAKESDKASRLRCGRDAEYLRMVGGDPARTPPLTVEEVEGWFAQAAGDPLHWIIEYEGRCIGAARLHSLDSANRRARYAVEIFDPHLRGQRLGQEATRLVLRYAFEELELHRVDLRVLDFNERAIACYERCGFVREGIEREGSRIGDRWCTDIVMSILEHEYRR